MKTLFAVGLFACLGAVPPDSSAGAKRPIKPTEPRDVFGRPLSWGKKLRGARLSIRMTRTRLRYGEPLEFFLRSENPPGKEGRWVRIEWEGSRRFRRTAEAVLTDGRGTPVPLVLDIGSMAGLRRPASRGWLRLLPAAARKVAGVVEGEAIVFQEPDCRGGLP